MTEKFFKILPPKLDFVFKCLFGDERNKDILAAFLKAVLELPDEEFSELHLLNTELKKEHIEDKYGILDVRVITRSGTQIDIEIQLHNKSNMIARSLYYWSKLYSEQAQEGDDYSSLCRTIAINILDFNIFNNQRYHNSYLLYEKDTMEKLTDLIQIDFLELEKVRRQSISNDDKKLEWTMFLANEDEEVFSMLAQKDQNINKAYTVLRTLSADPQTRELAFAREKAIKDYNASISFAKAEGIAEGMEKANIDMAKKLLAAGSPLDFIVQITGLNNKDIERLKH